MKIYIKSHKTHAGKWIYAGYARAWEELGYDVEFFDSLKQINDNDYAIMIPDGAIEEAHVDVIQRSKKTYIYTQPNSFPEPWGSHPNFRCGCSDSLIQKINEMQNTVLWSWVNFDDNFKEKYYSNWKEVQIIPLAFDPISYKKMKNKDYEYDICFVGGWVNNGFNEKKKIMLEYFKHLMRSNLKCGIFVGKNISDEQENLILYNSKLALNIHDNYQRVLGLDTNERTFKSLGLTGALVCDKIQAVTDLFSELPTYESPQEMMTIIERYLSNDKLLRETKKHYRNEIRENHTYAHRVRQLLDL
tara:strand:- start:129 stop:1034 length:906 start_codon:yes stop_codon:yes gene_type:complete